MLSITRWDPYRDMTTLQNRINRMFNEGGLTGRDAEGFGAWLPPVDVVEEGDNLVFRAELPGVAREEIDVKVENGILTLRGEKRQEKETTTESTHRVERVYGTFHRAFTLPSSVDAEKIQARYKDGVLELVLPKAEEAKPRR
ncbi:MAG TPA: Hsp20/alpha crystallin family protein, partial [Candidatus Polarisedimenticolia bacterium]|nr:Hsp20/alpha crystallin family protein [Candidatus Polarisedimenticolia bacterium]